MHAGQALRGLAHSVGGLHSLGAPRLVEALAASAALLRAAAVGGGSSTAKQRLLRQRTASASLPCHARCAFSGMQFPNVVCRILCQFINSTWSGHVALFLRCFFARH